MFGSQSRKNTLFSLVFPAEFQLFFTLFSFDIFNRVVGQSTETTERFGVA